MDPFFGGAQIDLRIVDPVQIHTDADIDCSYRGQFGNRRVVFKECHKQDQKEIVDSIARPNLLMRLGQIPGFEIWEDYYCNLSEFLEKYTQKYKSDPLWTSLVVDFSSQILKGLQVLHKRKVAHCNLILKHVAIQIDLPEDHQNTCLTMDTHFFVKLKDYDMSRAGQTEDFLNDLKGFGQILEHFSVESEEASDLLCRIHGKWESIDAVSSDQGQYLSELFNAQYLRSPIRCLDHPFFWSPLKCLEFISLVNEFLVVYYEEKIGVHWSIKDFVSELKKFDMDEGGWMDGIHVSIRRRALRKVRGQDDQKTSVGILKCIRNVSAHYIAYKKEEKEVIGKNDCYEHFRVKHPKLLIHTYRCLELHYEKMTKYEVIDAGCDWTFMPYISSVITMRV